MPYPPPQWLYGVIGWPLAQSLSPLLHNTAFQKLGIHAAYTAWPLPPENLESFMAALELFQVRGLSVTIPHKQRIIPLLAGISPTALTTGAVNTVYWREGELWGDNTDVAGFLAPLGDVPVEQMPTLLLGAGGAARAVVAGLHQRNCPQVWITSPGNKRQFSLADEFAITPISWEKRAQCQARLVINATPAGMLGHGEEECPYTFFPPSGQSWAYDLVYNPLRTRFLREAASAGWHCISGLAMFLAQGAAQFHLWTGEELPAGMWQVLEQALTVS